MKKRKYEKVEDLLFAYMGTMHKMELAGALLENDKNLSLIKA